MVLNRAGARISARSQRPTAAVLDKGLTTVVLIATVATPAIRQVVCPTPRLSPRMSGRASAYHANGTDPSVARLLIDVIASFLIIRLNRKRSKARYFSAPRIVFEASLSFFIISASRIIS